jgi:hypothetical protein
MDEAQRQLIADLAREQVAQVAPHELPLFRATSEAYFRHPEEAQMPQHAEDTMLGFGVESAVSFLTPVVLSVTMAAVSFLADEIRKRLKDESASVVNDAVKRLFKRFHGAEGGAGGAHDVELTHEELVRVRQIAFEKARQFNLAEAQANLLADSLAGSLAIA